MRFFLLAALLAPVLAIADPTVPGLMRQAQQSYLARDYETATQLFNEVLEVDPQNTLAIQYLHNIRIAQAISAPVKDPLESLMIPHIQFKEATFSAALDFFKEAAARQSVNVSFVSQLPAAQMVHSVTLDLTNIPFLSALHYLCQLNNAAFDQERYAIVIKPNPDGLSGAPAAQ
jgi:tetratricopeptide (TPR) repeat protein